MISVSPSAPPEALTMFCRTLRTTFAVSLVGAVVEQVVGRVGDERLLADEPEQRDAHQQRREQRHHRVVRQRRRVVGHLVREEALARAHQDLVQRRAPDALAVGRAVSAGGLPAPACTHP